MSASDSPAQPRERLSVVVHGTVQGVGFRYFVRRRAVPAGLVGWVANESDGTVRCVAEGPPDRLDRLLAAIREGPPGALVTRVDVTRGPAAGRSQTFDIRSGGHRGD